MSDQRKATDVLLDLESKIDLILGSIRTMDLNIKVLSNKLNDIVIRLDKQQAGPQKIIVETSHINTTQHIVPGFTNIPGGDPERNIPILSESNLPQENAPQGFRRTSRPESYVGKKGIPPEEIKMPMQIPEQSQIQKPSTNKSAPPSGRTQNLDIPINKNEQLVDFPDHEQSQNIAEPQNSIPIMQRCVDKSGKAIFLANVEIMNMANNEIIFKTRTNATGKWMAALPIGIYRATIRKLESVTKEKVEAIQDIRIDGSISKLELPMLIIK
jgi:hypothetical protein